MGVREDRRPAAEASLLYNETDESIAKRAEVAANQRIDYSVSRGMRGEGRPSKRQRRQIVRFRNQNDVDIDSLQDSEGDSDEESAN